MYIVIHVQHPLTLSCRTTHIYIYVVPHR